MSFKQDYEVNVSVFTALNRNDIMIFELTTNGDMGLKTRNQEIISLPISVNRTFRDFAKLDELLLKHHPSHVPPALPEKNPAMSLLQDRDYLSKVARRVKVYLRRLAVHPYLCQNPLVVDFLSQTPQFNPVIDEVSNKGSEKKKKSFFKSITTFTNPKKTTEILPAVKCVRDVVDADSFEEKVRFIVPYHKSMQDFSGSVLEMDRSRRALSTCFYNLGNELNQFCKKIHFETDHFARKLSISGQGCLKAYTTLQDQTESDIESIQDLVVEYSHWIGNVKSMLNYRTERLQEYNSKVEATEQKSAELKTHGRSLKYDPTKTAKCKKDLEELVRVESFALKDYENAVEKIDQEWKSFHRIRKFDFINMIQTYAKMQLYFEKKQFKSWRSILDEIRFVY